MADGRVSGGGGGGKGNDGDRGTVRAGEGGWEEASGSFTDRKINYGELATDGSFFLFFHADEWSRGVGEPGRAEKCLFNAGLLLLSVPHKRYGGVMEGQCCSASEPTAELATA